MKVIVLKEEGHIGDDSIYYKDLSQYDENITADEVRKLLLSGNNYYVGESEEEAESFAQSISTFLDNSNKETYICGIDSYLSISLSVKEKDFLNEEWYE